MREKLVSQKEKAKHLLSLHSGGTLLVLPNVWDPIGARILEKKGYPAVATASAAISASLGYLDGEKIRRDTLLGIVRRIVQSVNVPVSVDIEAGYGASIPELQQTIEAVIDAGAVGINIEDSHEEEGALREIDEQCERIAAVRETAKRRDLQLVINARVDTFLSSSFANDQEVLEETVARAKAYTAAGADCIYPVGPGDQTTVRLLRWRIESPLNILASPGATPLSVLRDIGVNRVSFGPFIFRSCMRQFANIADGLLKTGDYDCFGQVLSREETGSYLIEGSEPGPSGGGGHD